MGKEWYNVVVAGEPHCGKNTFLTKYAKSKLNNYDSSKFKNEKIKVTLEENQVVGLSIWNTSGIELNIPALKNRVRKADAIILCYAIDDPATLTNLDDNWIFFVKKWNNAAPLVLLGNKEYLRDDEETIRKLAKYGKEPVPKYVGEALSQKISACGYLECSALEDLHRVEEVFKTAAWACLQNRSKKYCTIL